MAATASAAVCACGVQFGGDGVGSMAADAFGSRYAEVKLRSYPNSRAGSGFSMAADA